MSAPWRAHWPSTRGAGHADDVPSQRLTHTGQEAVRLYTNTAKERQMVSRSMTQVGKWARRIGGGALVLALVGLSAPATTSARIYEDETPEEIEIEGDAPLSSPWWHGGYTGGADRALGVPGMVGADRALGEIPPPATMI